MKIHILNTQVRQTQIGIFLHKNSLEVVWKISICDKDWLKYWNTEPAIFTIGLVTEILRKFKPLGEKKKKMEWEQLTYWTLYVKSAIKKN